MAVIVKYVVERNGEEKMTFTSKAEADAYDKMLDMADELFDLLGKSDLLEDEGKQEDLAMFLAQNKEELLYALGAKRRPTPKKEKKLAAVADDAAGEDESAEDAA
ncbi:multidrug DMT transporter permease [Vibrio vulnificus]|jgi:dsDNA-binding SOS-regulon protein|uniref:Multidrug DMT transporter permease n=1 Tax=Vibrio vulnificus TaxID=672 RepID=A0AAW4HBS1_VIBVL|nr:MULTISPECIES: YebG family protein [Vibrio]EWS69418.1 2-hydroxyacid dehydrogenase [Vibrio vulnificus BAA87]ASC57865.1 2-hydroxyacid dehydrogenase [Vibrio vulnificus]ASJ37860.1 multidrug DMT transporter permease [Vibrio vulnificus]ASM96939.1 multidrug DMT transporter permease [Vibrio vulnificus NBRC 15645 = ATCC 27562]AUL96462.1 2-hydroxyacid dehydrogenase [Vibrio vulnificus]